MHVRVCVPAHEVEVLQVLVVRHARVGADLHAHLVDTRVLEQCEVGVEQPGQRTQTTTTTTTTTPKATATARGERRVISEVVVATNN